MLELSVKSYFFFIDGKLYKQDQGLGMGLPLGPTCANIIGPMNLDTHCPAFFKQIFYKRYVDDVFLLFKEQYDSTLFLDYINGKHPNTKLSIEGEVDGTLSFLDCTVTKTNKKIVTSVYRKPTFSWLGISYFSLCASRFKINVIKTLLYGAYNVSTNYQLLHREFDFLIQIFHSIGFPLNTLTPKFVNICLNVLSPLSLNQLFNRNFMSPSHISALNLTG